MKYNDEALEGVKITVEGGGFEAETETDENGQWTLGVPEKSTYEVTLDEDTLPDGVVVEDGQSTIEAEFGLTSRKSVNFFLGEGQRVTVNLLDQVIQRAVNGINFGLLLALAAIGLSLIFGTTGLSNFAHAELITFGALMVLTLGVDFAWPLWLAIAGALVLSAVLGLGLDAAIWKPLRKRGVGVIQLMIVSIGLSLALRYTYQFFYGGSTRQLPGATLPPTSASDRSRSRGSTWRACSSASSCCSRSPTSCSAPGPARPRARSPTTRLWPPRAASTSTESSASSGSSARCWPACPASSGRTSDPV
ncbi:hypothetical protein GCM10025870_26360 [Agromyces marinus]|uniref:Branched-chain amino acid ABC transporter permease n=1 Tax=Agromyces marinus TaxID=1389020 RepID=A0ABM8H440_9MICO|nr:hypothetical protein GCM10025870_26360 [Agromyces marinus]